MPGTGMCEPNRKIIKAPSKNRRRLFSSPILLNCPSVEFSAKIYFDFFVGLSLTRSFFSAIGFVVTT